MNWKRIKAALAAGALSMALIATCAAQSAPAPAPDTTQPPSATAPGAHAKEHRKAMRDEMAKLNLTDDQKSQIKAIHAKAKEQVQAVKSDTTLTDAQKKAKLRGIRMDTRKQVSGVLTPEQRQTLREDMKQRRQAKQQNQQPS